LEVVVECDLCREAIRGVHIESKLVLWGEGEAVETVVVWRMCLRCAQGERRGGRYAVQVGLLLSKLGLETERDTAGDA